MTEKSITLALRHLEAQLGTEVHRSDWITVTQERVDAFATITGDEQWIHTDPERARRDSPFGGTIAHGYLTLSLQVQLRGGSSGALSTMAGVRSVINYGLDRVRFPTPVRIGRRLRGRFTLQSVEQVAPDVLQLTERYTAEVEGESKPACVADSVMRLVFG